MPQKQQPAKKRPVFKFMQPGEKPVKVKFEVTTYQYNNNLCITLVDARYEEYYSRVTVNFDEKLEPYTAYVDGNFGVLYFLIENDIGIPQHFIIGDDYALFKFAPLKLLEVDPMCQYPC